MEKEFLQRYFEYKDGQLICKYTGSVVGSSNTNGYYVIRFFGKTTLVHRLIWSIHHGPIPNGLVLDHIDRNIKNNKIENLRVVTPSGNSQNKPVSKHSVTGYKGVSWHKVTGKWKAYITINGKYKHLGVFTEVEDAISKRLEAEVEFNYLTNKVC